MKRINCENRISSKLSFIESLIRVPSTWIMDHGPYELTKMEEKKKREDICESTLYGFQCNTFIRFLCSFFLFVIHIHFFNIVNIKHYGWHLLCFYCWRDSKWEMFVLFLFVYHFRRAHIVYLEYGSYGSWALGLY